MAKRDDLLQMTSDIVAAYVSHNAVSAGQIPDLIASVHESLQSIKNAPDQKDAPKPVPAVPIADSLHEDYIICLEDGERFKSLKRHLRTKFDLTPAAYREKWGLPNDYPMVAPSYARQRSQLAKKMGLGKGATESDA